jgi:hypothetical protein
MPMWNFDPKKMLEYYMFNSDMANSSLAYPRLPPTVNHSAGISKTAKLKEDIIRDNATMLARLYDFQTMFQKNAAGLFDLVPNQFGPGHPLHLRTNFVNSLQLENEQLRKENAVLKRDLEKHKQK